MRVLDYATSEARLFFWRTHTGTEVDLLIVKHGKVRAAFEIKAKPNPVGADLTGLRSFSADHPKVPCYAVTLAPRGYAVGGIEVLPYAEFLERLDTWI
jgi:predicted AAA+ superfamily ATPase